MVSKKSQVNVKSDGVGSGGASLAGYEYQIDVSVWLALDLVLANKLTQELVLEPAGEEDIEADLSENEAGRLTSIANLQGYRLIVQAKLRSGDAWTVPEVSSLLRHGKERPSAAKRLESRDARYLLVTSAAVNGGAQKLKVRSAGNWPKAADMPASLVRILPSGSAGRVAIISSQDQERLNCDIKLLLTERFCVPNAQYEQCRLALREEARGRIGGAGGGRWTRAELEPVIRRHNGYLAGSPELEHYVHPTNWGKLRASMTQRHAALIIGQSGTGKTMATKMLYEELRQEMPGLTRVSIANSPQQIHADQTTSPVLFDIEDPWGRFDFDIGSQAWNEQLANLFSTATAGRMIIATSRRDVAQMAGALDGMKPWLVELEAEHYARNERGRLYQTRIPALPRHLQHVATSHQGTVLAALATPLEIQKFFDALATLDFSRLHGQNAVILKAVEGAHENSIERTVVEQIKARQDGRAAAVLWGLLKAYDRLSLSVLRSVEDELADLGAEFDKGVLPLVNCFVAARNLRQVEATVTYYHPRVEAGIEKVLTVGRILTQKALRALIDVLTSLDEGGNVGGWPGPPVCSGQVGV